MKRLLASLFILILCLELIPLPAEADTYLSPAYKCPVRPTIYSNRRYRKVGEDRAYEINKDFSVSMIRQNKGYLEYGLYLKFTPGRSDNGYYISRFDTVISDPYGNIVYRYGYDTNMTCQYGYYWYWDFYNLDGMFSRMLSQSASSASQ